MITQVKLYSRSVTPKDKQQLANLIHFENHVHRHLDWRPPLDWIGYEPYLVAESGKQLVAALACPPDPPEVAWIRLFAASSDVDLKDAWWSLWELAIERLHEHNDIRIAAIPLHDWFRRLLQLSDFERTHHVIMLLWERRKLPPPHRPPDISIRPMNMDDLPAVEQVDRAAFDTLWRNSRESLEHAFRQSAISTVAEKENIIVGYQISTANHMSGHLARLAIDPGYQGQGIGYSLLQDLLLQFEKRGARNISVNTQQDNEISITLYEKAGFKRTGESYPVYQYHGGGIPSPSPDYSWRK
jgi:ribosomal protein S18 acetylase RimI-like enzyme